MTHPQQYGGAACLATIEKKARAVAHQLELMRIEAEQARDSRTHAEARYSARRIVKALEYTATEVAAIAREARR